MVNSEKKLLCLSETRLWLKVLASFIKHWKTLPQDRQALIIDEVNAFLVEVVEAHIVEAQLKEKKWSLKPEIYLQVLTKKAADIEGRMKVGAIYGGGS